jgi:nuclear pore complex protein Nup98-Nup96
MIDPHKVSDDEIGDPDDSDHWASRPLPSNTRSNRDNLLTKHPTGAFGTTQPSTGFGAKPAFGASTSTGGGLFGSNTAAANTSSAFGGFGSTNTATSSPFGTGSTGGGLFGQANKPAFGAATNTTSSPFGGATTTGFGSTSSTFGATGTALGANVGDCQGTGAVPFQPYIEKEPNSASNQQNAFQSIVFQPPYQKFSPEELRLADYAQGRKYGNASGQAGAFGTNSGFGGFGSNNTTSAFGSNNNAGTGLFGSTSSTTPFGQNNQNTSSGFGSTNTGSLFGNKPATTGGLFGAQTQPASGTGLFGSTGSTGFGSTNTGGFGSNTNTGTSLFGNNNQNKPGFSFGTQQPSTTGTGFGTTNTGTTGAFGSGASLFGNNTATQNASTPFGGTNQAANNPFGGFVQNSNTQTGTTSLFNNNQQKPTGSLFGNNTNPTTGTSLFGNTTNTTSNPFGGNSNNTQTTSLFAPKPAPTLGGSSLFGNNNNNATTSNTGGLFGNSGGFGQNNQNQQNQNSGSSLFGNLNQQQPKPSLFGSTQNQSTGGSLFGNNTTTQGGSSLFGSLNNNQNQQPQQQQTSLFGGSFGGSQQNQQSQPQSLTASISDPTAFGTSMFSNLATPQIQNPGPLATPLSSLSKQKKSSVLPMYKMNPASSSRFTTPQKRGFGFSYSTYGTPGSASSTSSTPLTFGNSMLGGGLNRGLSKSVSTSSLRGSYTSTFNREDSILAPGAFSASPSSRFNSTGSMKKLVINRGIRTDLFSPPSKEPSPSSNQSGILKKRVSFDASTVGGNANGHVNGNSPLKQVQSSATPNSEELGYLRSSTRSSNGNGNGNGNRSKTNGAASPPEMEQVKGNELAIVPEEEPAAPASSKPRAKPTSQEDQEPGRYWMKPSKEEIMNMNRMQRQKVTGFTVGRDGVGHVEFDVPVDLTNIDLDGIFDKLVILNIRQATVYPDQSKKPPVGKGLNVPSTIKLENSWPRGKDKRNPSHEKAGPRFQKHIERLSKVPDTEFKDYDKETGVWTFTVEHFTTYGLEYDDDETDGEAMSEFGQSTLSAPPDTPTPQSRTSKAQAENSFSSTEMSGSTESDPEDTFDFKKKKILPGAFDNQAAFEEEADMEDDEQDSQPFLDERSVGSPSEDGVEEPMDQDDHFQGRELVRIEDQEMAGSYPQLDDTAEQEDEYSQEDEVMATASETPGAIMRARMRAMRTTGSPLKRKIKFDDNDWAEMLRQSVSPQKQDREQLKRMRDSINNGAILGDDEKDGAANSTMRGRVVSDGRGFATSIDLMHSLFGEARSPVKSVKIPQKGKGFEVGLPSCA